MANDNTPLIQEVIRHQKHLHDHIVVLTDMVQLVIELLRNNPSQTVPPELVTELGNLKAKTDALKAAVAANTP